jgi:hypothetical protein
MNPFDNCRSHKTQITPVSVKRIGNYVCNTNTLLFVIIFLSIIRPYKNAAPDNCLQWFTEASGTLVSFNYQYAAAPVVQHLAYQDYTMCIRTNQVKKQTHFKLAKSVKIVIHKLKHLTIC